MATSYIVRFNNVEEQMVEAIITEEITDFGDILLQGAEDAVRIVSQDNDESKYSPIKAKKCIIKFLNTPEINLRTFATGEDNKFLVTIKINSLNVFVGRLEQGDIEEPFQYEQNQIVTLTATDGLGLLKTHRLADIFDVWTTSGDGCGPNENRIIDYIAACLGASSLLLTINVINNLREQDNPVTDTSTFGNIYAALYLDIKMFEDTKIGELIYAYDALERILGHDCYLTQAKGMWWIVRVTELRQDFDMMKTVFDFNGDVLSFSTLNYEKAIGLKDVTGTPFPGTPDATAYFSQDNTMLALQRPVKYVTLRYNYENAFELLNNSSLQRGAFITDLPDELDPDGNALTVKAFVTDCWAYEKYTATLPPVLTTQDSTEYTKVRYRNGVEVDRFIHFDPTAAHPATYQLRSLARIPIGAYDQFVFSMSFKWSADLGGAKPYFVRMGQFRLYADDGTFWGCNASNDASTGTDSGNFWMQTDSDFIALVPVGVNNTPSILYSVQENTDLSSWISASYNIPSAPRSGKVEIVLWLRSEDTTAFSRDMASLNLEYTPYINGSYNIFTSQADTSTRDGFYIPAIEEEVFITNSPRPIFKGSLLKFDGTDFVPVGQFYEGQQFDSSGGAGHLATYGELRVRAYHNQVRNGDEIYRATCQGLGEGVVDADGEDDHQDLIHRYFNRDIEAFTNYQAFQLVSQDVDLRNCEWTGTLIKNFDITIGFIEDTYHFSYGAAGTSQGGASGGGSGASIPPGGGGRFAVSGEDDTGAQPRSFDATDFDFTITDVQNFTLESNNTFAINTQGTGLITQTILAESTDGGNVASGFQAKTDIAGGNVASYGATATSGDTDVQLLAQWNGGANAASIQVQANSASADIVYIAGNSGLGVGQHAFLAPHVWATQFTPASNVDATYAEGTITLDDTYLWYRSPGLGVWVKIPWQPF